jgi:hypothetical protein
LDRIVRHPAAWCALGIVVLMSTLGLLLTSVAYSLANTPGEVTVLRQGDRMVIFAEERRGVTETTWLGRAYLRWNPTAYAGADHETSDMTIIEVQGDRVVGTWRVEALEARPGPRATASASSTMCS